MRHLSERTSWAVRDWSSPESNPFLARALRIETRKHKPFLTLLGVALLMVLVATGVWQLWEWIRGLGTINGRGLGASYPIPGTFPIAMGGHPVGFLAIVTLTCSVLGAVYSTRARAAYLLRQEMLGSTLDHLQLLPQPEERWLWWMSAHPFGLSMLIALAGLPVYALAWATGAWDGRDLLGIALLFAFIGYVAPGWQPQMWQQQVAKKSGKPWKVDWKALQEALKQNREEAPASTLDAAQQLEMQRRAQRLMAGTAEIPATSPPTEETDGKTKNKAIAGYSFGNNNGCSPWLFGWIGLQFFSGALRATFRTPTGGGPWLLWHNFWDALPPAATSLVMPGPGAIPVLLLNWPLLIARIIVAPLPFFALQLPPFLLLVPLWLGWKFQANTMLAAQVSPRETFWTPERATLRSRIGLCLWLLVFALIVGFGWQSWIRDGLMIGLLRGTPSTLTPVEDWALAGFWTLLLFVATVLAGSTLEKPVQWATRMPDIVEPNAWKEAGRSALRILGAFAALYFLSCWLGGHSGINAAWLSRLGASVLIVGAFLLADAGSGALQMALPPGSRGSWSTLRQIWFHGLALLTLVLIVYCWVRGTTFSFEMAPWVLLCPWITVLSLFRYELIFPALIPGAAWTMWWPLALQAFLGLMCWTLTRVLNERQGEAAPVIEQDEKHSIVDILLWPWMTLGRGLRTLMLGILNAFEWLSQRLRSWNDALADRTIGLYNPVFTEELRRRLHREFWIVQWFGIVLSGVFLFYLFADVPAMLQGGATALGNWGESLVSFTLAVAIFATGLSALSMGKSFDRERSNGTLVFLFLTPLTDREIVRGKWLPGLYYALLLFTTALPWLLIGNLAAWYGGNFQSLWYTLLGMGIIAINWLFVAALTMLFSVRAHKPNEGGGKALLAALFCYVSLGGITGWLMKDVDAAATPQIAAGAGIFIACLLLLLTWAAWRGALYSLRQQRYNESTQRGKGAS
jgi:hypothetical protein